MSRTYANFLLFEEVLDNIPTSSPVMRQAVGYLLNPMVKVVEEDCGTFLGEMVDTSLELQGKIETVTGDPLTAGRIIQLLSQGTYKVGIRNLTTCLSHTSGGICRKCYAGTYLGDTAPAVGSNLSIPSSLIYQTDVLIGDGATTTFTLSETSDDWYSVKVINQGVIVPSSQYTLGYNTITFNTAPVLDSTAGLYVVHFHKQNTDPFQGWIAKTYSGSLLGMQALPSLKPLLRMSLYEAQFSDSFVSMIVEETSKIKTIPVTYINYIDSIHDKMEKVLLALYLYAIYSNVVI